jgi:signal transduction histidine kinase
MKKFLQTFYGKLSLLFLFLLLILGAVQIYITMESSRDFVNVVDQKLNLNLAKDMTFELKPLLTGELDFNKIGERIHYMMVMNPKVEIYVLDEFGKILAFFAEPGKAVELNQVDLEPIRKFINSAEDIPILGDDPRNPDQKKPFSASNLSLGENEKGYLYIVIGSELYESAASLLRDNYIVKTLIKGLMFSVVVAGVIGLLLFALLTNRLRSMSGVVREFEHGNYDKRITTKRKDEIGQLANSFNNMADTIVANIEAIKRKDDLRRELIANVSHDLRSPLTSIQGYLETIMIKENENNLKPDSRARYLEIIHKNTEKLNKMVHELFELSKLEAKQIQPKLESFSLAELAQDVVMKYKNQAEKTKVTLNSQIPPDLPYVTADIALIERVISNLLENAIDYTSADGLVSIELHKKKGNIRTIISDSGSGISSDDLPYIFDRFYKSKISRSKNKSSTGLGLAIANKIIEAHHSTITVKSQINKGTTFFFDLPLHTKG